MWQKLSLQQKLRVDDSLVLGVSLSLATLSDVVESVLLCLNHLRVLKTRPQRFFHLGGVRTVKTDPVEDLLVTEAVESAEKDHQGYRLFD